MASIEAEARLPRLQPRRAVFEAPEAISHNLISPTGWRNTRTITRSSLQTKTRRSLQSSSLPHTPMAAVQSLTITRSAATPSVFLSPIAASSVYSVRATLKSANLPDFTGLRIRSGASTRHLRPATARSVARRSGRVVCESPDTAIELPAVTDSTWQSLVLDSDIPVLVEFWAPWCGPCRMIHPVIDELAKQYAGKLKCFKVNTDESPSIATRYGIRSIPTVMIFKNGEKKDTVIGAVPQSTLATSIDKLL